MTGKCLAWKLELLIRRIGIASLAVCLALAAFVQLALAQGTYTKIDVPVPWHASGTWLYGINSAGDIAGFYVDGTDNSYHGFSLSAGDAFTHIDANVGGYPLDTFPSGLNDQGQLVGSTYDVGFSYDRDNGTFKRIVYPDSRSTSAHGINNSGTIVGSAEDQQYHYFGWELTGGTYIKIEPPDSELSGVRGINNSGAMTVFAQLHSGLIKSYLFREGKFHEIKLPRARSSSIGGINDSNAVVGCYQDANNNTVGFLRRQGEQVVILKFPGSLTTCPTSINNAGTVVGYFIVTGNISHGFIWTHPAPAETK